MTQDVAAVAAKLSDADRAAVLNHKGWWQRLPLADEVAEKSGYVGEFGWVNTYRLTTLGIAVRDHLLKEAGR